MNDAEITLIRYRMDRSKEALSAAGLMYEKGHYNDAVNRLYYSCFYAVIALLATEGIHPGKHTAARAFLNKKKMCLASAMALRQIKACGRARCVLYQLSPKGYALKNCDIQNLRTATLETEDYNWLASV